MTLKEETYWDRPDSFSEDLDRILAKSGASRHEATKVIVMGKAKVLLGDKHYRVTFHETWTRTE